MATDQIKNFKKNAALLYSLGRSMSYIAEQQTLRGIDFWVNRGNIQKKPITREQILETYKKIYRVLEQDAENIAQGVYPYSVLEIENPLHHLSSALNVFLDAFKVSKRRRDKVSHDLDARLSDEITSAPEYSKRNFHFQTNGYFSDDSADLYDHQVEILFAGSSFAMRRLILPLFKKHIATEGEGLSFLELGCGTGALTRFVKLAYPKAKITAVDMSSTYLKKAQSNLADLNGINFIQAHAEELPFKDQTFDLVYSCYLFHELPLKVRHQVLQESLRVSKIQGLIGIVDSIQNHDDTDLTWALDVFPKDFHEPFYKNYVQHPMEELINKNGMSILESSTGFLTKAILAAKKT